MTLVRVGTGVLAQGLKMRFMGTGAAYLIDKVGISRPRR